MGKTLRQVVDETNLYKNAWNVCQYVVQERLVQNEKWGEQNEHSLEKWYTILGEEFGEVGRAILEGEQENLKEELIQLAAVAVAIYEHLDGGKIA